jgi:drug/metabolite transporter (DMT)-like permease
MDAKDVAENPTGQAAPDAGALSTWLALALLAALLFWASAFAVIRIGLQGGYSPQSLALLRFLSGSVAILVMAPFVKVNRPSRHDVPLLLVAAIAGGPVYHFALNSAESNISAGTAALLINISPVLAALLAAAVLRERPGIRGWTGTLISFAGAAVIASRDGWQFNPQALWVLLAAAAGAVYTVSQKPVLRSMTPLGFTSWSIWIGTACLLPILPRLVSEFRTATHSATWAGIYMGIFPTALSYVMWAKVISRMNVSRAVSFLYLVPVFAVVLAWLLLGERPEVIALFGGTLVICGVMLVNASRKPRSRPQGSPVITRAEA